MTEIGDIIQPCQPIPDDVTDMADAQNPTEDWPRWVRHRQHAGWDFWISPVRAEQWRMDTDRQGRPTDELVEDGRALGWAPFRVLAVREQPAEPERAAEVGGYPRFAPDAVLVVDMHNGHEQWTGAEWNEYVGSAERSRNMVTARLVEWPPPIASEPAVEPVPDVLDLVRQYGTESYQTGCAERHDEAATAEHDDASRALFARIEAEVQRLRAAAQPPLADIIAAKAAEVKPILLEMRPVVLSLPQVPEQARNFAGHPWWIHGCGTAWAASGTPRVKCPGCDHNDKPWRPLFLGEVMREPRTWPRLDGAPEDLSAVRGTSGKVYEYIADRHVLVEYGTNDPRPFFEVQFRDGPLVEVFDDEDGTR